MSELTMSKAAREAFLADLHVAVLAVERPDGPPLLAPVWYRYEPGGEVLVNTGVDSEKAALLEQVGRASLLVQREDLPPAFVTVEGPVVLDRSDPTLERTRIAERYLGVELAAGYLESTKGTQNVTLRLTPERWRTQDYAQRT